VFEGEGDFIEEQPKVRVQRHYRKTFRRARNFLYDVNGLLQKLNYETLKLEYLPTPKELSTVKPGRFNRWVEEIVRKPGLYPLQTLKAMAKGELGTFYDEIPAADSVDYSMIWDYSPPSKDGLLLSLTKEHKCQFMLSTSTLSSFMIHLSFILTGFSKPSRVFVGPYASLSVSSYFPSIRRPDTVFLRLVDTHTPVYALDKSDLVPGQDPVFLKMGKYMEMMVKQEPEEFRRRYLLSHKGQRETFDVAIRDFYSYLKVRSLMLRSQIDARFDDGTGEMQKIEIKTRVCAPARYDPFHATEYSDYEIMKLHGHTQSYELERKDISRSAAPMYLHQMMIGGMHGAMIAYHNTKSIFGFEYVPREVFEKVVYGSREYAHMCFKSALWLLEEILKRVCADHPLTSPQQALQIGYFAEIKGGTLTIFAEKIDDLAEYSKIFTAPEARTEQMDIIDYYERAKLSPRATKYAVKLFPKLYGQWLHPQPRGNIKGEELETHYTIRNLGEASSAEYLLFLQEAQHSEFKNVGNEYNCIYPV
jgi:hypothetical protein